MQLKSFQVKNYRSINDSGEIEVSRITALLGRNESGKSNLLRALHSLNPVDGVKELSPIKDFPRHRKLSDCTPTTPVLQSSWILTEQEKKHLSSLWPAAEGVSEVFISRAYSASRTVRIPAPGITFDHAAIKVETRKIDAAVRAKGAELAEPSKSALENAASTFSTVMMATATASSWATAATPALAALRQALAAAGVELPDTQDEKITALEEMAEEIAGNDKAHTDARRWVLAQLPKFMFLEDYPKIEGHQNIAAFLERGRTGTKTPEDANFEKLCKVAGLDPDELNELLQKGDNETRSQLVNRAGSVVTAAIRKRWKDRELKVRFNLDANYFDTLISDPNSAYDVEVNLDERSRGFQWFFAFYIVFAADTDDGEAEGAILLLDEPGLFLHARSQGDLLRHLEDDFPNQILYTTHSPFMVPTHQLSWVRTVNIAEEAGTTVSNDPAGDARTLFPLQAALGYDLAQSLFVGQNNLTVEGITDYWVLAAVSAYLVDQGKTGLDARLTVTPCGGAQKVHYMVALLTSQQLNVLVLLDDEKGARATREDLVTGKLIRSDNVIFASEAFETVPDEADIEDILDPAVYESLVRESYAKELKGKKLELNPRVPRIARRFEAAFEAIGIPFHKTRTTRLFLQKMERDPSSVLPEASAKQFERLFQAVNAALAKHLARTS